jgi:prephenate dehydrogenase
LLAEADVLFVATPHRAYRELPPIEGKLVIDVWSCLQRTAQPAAAPTPEVTTTVPVATGA